MKYIASTIVRASDIGLNDNLFGGTLLRWLDEYGALFVYKYLKHTFVTYKMQKTYFLKSAKQGQCIDFYVTNLKFDKISVNFDLVAKINSYKPAKEIINTNMTFVAIDVAKEKPCRLNPVLFETEQFEKMMLQNVEKYLSNDDTIFHNLKHVEDMLTQLNMYKAMIPVQEYKKLYLAICYHDIVYISQNQDNEEKSIELLKRHFGNVFDVSDIEKLIMCTKISVDYEEIKKIKYADLLHDLDMISFIDYETMKANDVKIRTEYNHLSTLEFYEYKLSYLDKLIKKGVFISTYYKKYNAIAIDNIKKYIEEIKQLIKQMKENK